MPASYLPGTGTLIGRGTRWVLLDRPCTPELVGPLWTALAAGARPEELVAVGGRLAPGSPVVAVDTTTGLRAAQGGAVAEEGGTVLLRLRREPDRADLRWLPVGSGAVGAGAALLSPAAPVTEPGARPVVAAVALDAPPLPRAALGSLALPDGRWVRLDRGAVLGRQPEPLPAGDPWPHLVRLPTDRTRLSRRHLSVEVRDGVVVARDVGSLGGTVLAGPGRAAVPMRPREGYVLRHGDLLTLAGEYAVRFVAGPTG